MAGTDRAAALEYFQWGLIPLPAAWRTKHPIIPWKPFQGIKRATRSDIDDWFGGPKQLNIWLLCGPQSGIVVFDCDGADTLRWWRQKLGNDLRTIPRVKTSKGWHFYFKWAEGSQNWSFHQLYLGVRLDFEVRNGESGGVIAPPSKHDTTEHVYHWEVRPEIGPDGKPIWPDLPPQLYSKVAAGLAVETGTGGTSGRSQLADLLNNPPQEGGRNDWLTKVAGHYAKLHRSKRDLYDVEFDRAAAMTGLPAEEVEKTRESIWKTETQKAKTDPTVKLGTGDHHELTDLGNSRRLVDSYGDQVRYCDDWGSWLVWDKRRWARDRTGATERMTKTVIRGIHTEAMTAQDDTLSKALGKWAVASQSIHRIKATQTLAQTEPEVAVASTQLDRDNWLLNLEDGTLDLRAGLVRPHSQSDLITRLISAEYDPEAKAPEWEQFLTRVLPNEQVRLFVQRAVGYSLTGMVSEQALMFLYGEGANGKSVFLSVLTQLLGDYAITADHELLLASHGGNHPTNIADLQGARMVVCTEVDIGRSFAEARLKRLTGGDQIKARFMRQDFFEFAPTFTIWLAANHKPAIYSTSGGIWRRIRLVPFEVQIPAAEQIKDLDRMLLERESQGILAWAIRGCLDWQRNGLPIPDAIRQATLEYRADQDTLAQFLDDLGYVRAESVATSAGQLQTQYREWCQRTGEHQMRPSDFVSELERRGFSRQRSKTGWQWRGLGQDLGRLA